MNVDTRPFRILSLCTGVGGLELGLELAVANARPVCYVEREAYAAEVLATRMSEGYLDDAPVWTDLETFDGEPWRGVVDCITAGFPCQPVSVAGKRRVQEDERWIWPDIARIIRDVGPRLVFLENVPGLLVHGMGDVLGDLAAAGYDAEWGVFSAAGVGAPHLRKRVFILGYTRDEQFRQTADRCESANINRSSSETLADTQEHHERAGSAGEPQNETGERRRGLDGERGPFPPGPGDSAAWRYVLERWPELAPALANNVSDGCSGQGLYVPKRGSQQAIPDIDGPGSRRNTEAPQPAVRNMANGAPARVDQLRALGNVVVPVVAAVAFLTLAERLECVNL